MVVSDQELVRRFQAGERSAFEALVRRWDAKVLNLAYRLTGGAEDAKDIRQLAFLGCFKALSGFDREAQFSTWLCRIVINLCRDQQRSRSAGHRHADNHARLRRSMSSGDDPASSAQERHDAVQAVARAVAALPAQRREAVVLRHYIGLKFSQISVILDLPASTVESRVIQALKALRAQLDPERAERDPTGIQR